jgi:hypothetical protein
MQEAEHLLRTMHLPPDLVGWRSLLSCCSSFENADMSLQCFDEVSKRDPINGSAYALMSNVYMNDHIGGVELSHDVDDPIHRSISKPDCTNTFRIGANDDVGTIQKTMRNRFDSYIFFLLYVLRSCETAFLFRKEQLFCDLKPKTKLCSLKPAIINRQALSNETEFSVCRI